MTESSSKNRLGETFEASLEEVKVKGDRFWNTLNSNALEAALIALHQLIAFPEFAQLPPDERARHQDQTGTLYLHRFGFSRDRSDLDRSLEFLQKAIKITPEGSVHLPGRLDRLASALLDRHRSTGFGQDLEDAIENYEQSLRISSLDSSERAGFLQNLGVALLDRYRLAGNGEDLDKALESFESALKLLPAEPFEQRALLLNNFSAGLSDRFTKAQNPADLDRSIEIKRRLVAETNKDSPNYTLYLSNLGRGLRDRFRLSRDWEDLEEAAQVLETALSLIDPETPEYAPVLASFGSVLGTMYEYTGDPADFRAAFAAMHDAEKAAPRDSEARLHRLNYLARLLRHNHQRTGKARDLELAVTVHHLILDESRSDHPLYADYNNDLGNTLLSRYEATGNQADLAGAIEAYIEAVNRADDGSPYKPIYLNNLGNAYMARYNHARDRADLELAVETYRQSLSHSSPEALYFPRHVTNLSRALMLGFEVTGNDELLEDAITNAWNAVQITRANDPELTSRISTLGDALMGRYKVTRALDDLEQVVSNFRLALEYSLSGSIGKALYRRKLAAVLAEQAVRTNNVVYLNEAITLSEQAWESVRGARIANPILYTLQQQKELATIGELLVEAHLTRAGMRPWAPDSARVASFRQAMVFAEGIKSRLLSELLGRGQLPAPVEIPEELANREQDLLRRLADIDAVEFASLGGGESEESSQSRIERANVRIEVRGELEQIWSAMWDLGGAASDYVAIRRGDELSWEDLEELASDTGEETAFISQFSSPFVTQLFVYRKGLATPRVVYNRVDDSDWVDIRRRFLREISYFDGSSRRGETWDRQLLSLLEQALPHLEGVGRVLLSPRGLANLIPWSVMFERAILRTVGGDSPALVTLPTLNLLPRLLNRDHLQKPGMDGAGPDDHLVVGNPTDDLPDAEVEARAVADHLGTDPLIGPDARRRDVLEYLSRAKIAHLATHARFDSESPLDSGILLADGVLTAREILKHRLQADLLVLSACDTGKLATLAGDELIGLSQSFLQAGARSLLVSLWQVSDPATAALMNAFYQARETGLDKATALSAAQLEVRSKPGWAHPYYWGSFLLIGDWN